MQFDKLLQLGVAIQTLQKELRTEFVFPAPPGKYDVRISDNGKNVSFNSTSPFASFNLKFEIIYNNDKSKN